MQTLITLLFTTLSLSLSANSSNYTTLEYSDVFEKIEAVSQKYTPEEVLVVFDIDDTLLVIDNCQKSDGTFTKGIAKLYHCPSVHTESDLSTKIKEIQEQGFNTMALTARGVSMLKSTQRELAREHVNALPFNFHKLPYAENFKLEVPKTKKCLKGEVSPCFSGKTSKVTFAKGVMYAQGTHKGLALASFLAKTKSQYKAIIFVDDREKNTKKVNEIFSKVEDTETHIFLYLRHRD